MWLAFVLVLHAIIPVYPPRIYLGPEGIDGLEIICRAPSHTQDIIVQFGVQREQLR